MEELMKGLPKEYFKFGNYVRNKLKFSGNPNYEALKNMF